MTLRDLLPLVACIAVPLGLLYGFGRLSRWIAGRLDPIDALIAQNAAAPVAGMDRVDWQKAEKAGERVWCETLRAQRKARKKPRSKPQPKNVVDIKATRRSA